MATVPMLVSISKLMTKTIFYLMMKTTCIVAMAQMASVSFSKAETQDKSPKECAPDAHLDPDKLH